MQKECLINNLGIGSQGMNLAKIIFILCKHQGIKPTAWVSWMKQGSLMFFVYTLMSLNQAIAQTEYVKTDSSLIANVSVIVRTPSFNSRYIDVISKNDTVTYTPEDIIEYGSRYGNVYVSREINVSGEIKKVFLQQLVKGTATLFYYREKGFGTFFIEIWSETSTKFVEVTNKDRKNILGNILDDCEWVDGPIKIVKYTKRSLTKLVTHYNECIERPFSFIKFGISAGYGLTDMRVNSKFGLALRSTPISFGTEEIRVTPLLADGAPMFGFFTEVPLSLIDFSLTTGIYFSKNEYEFATDPSRVGRVDIISMKISSFDIPIMLRYTFLKRGIRPYTNFGPVFSFHTTNSNGVFNSNNENTVNFSFVRKRYFGLTAGAGVVKNIDHRKTFSLELRTSTFFGDDRSLGKNKADLILGFTL